MSFGKETTKEFRSTLEQLEGNIESLIIDLRGNSGGLLDCAIELCDMLLPSELDIVSIRTRQREITQRTYSSQTAPILSTKIPIVVLIDRYSASASEIMAGCLQDHGRATLIGEQTWGKGTVQDVLPIERGESALKLTTSSYWRPSGKNIDRDFAKEDGATEWGVQPDAGYEVELSELAAQRNEYYRSEYELRVLTGGMKFPDVLLKSANKTDENRKTDSVNVDSDVQQVPPNESIESPDDSSGKTPSLAPIDPNNYQDKPFQRALDFLKSTKPATIPQAA